MLSIAFLAFFSFASIFNVERIDAYQNISWSLFSSSTWLGGRSHRGTGEVKVRIDTSKLGKGALFLDDVDLKESSTGIIVRPPGIIAIRNAVPGWLHDWRPVEYCKVVVHSDQLTIVDVLLTGRTVRNADGSLSSKPVCRCLIQDHDTISGEGDAIRTCE